ncbi:hypothetical protein [Sphingorhabdus contaminans]|uniref:hypothetical protein n=1 Tax=Sphingorhabdus contaminans TaxID=1343899 RepID=UPI003D297EFD
MTTINRNVVNPRRVNISNITSKSVSLIQSSVDRLSQNLQSGADWLLHANEKYAQNQMPGQREATIFTINAGHTILSGFAQLPGALANPIRTINAAFWSSAEATDSFLRMNDTPARISIPAAANRLANSSSDDLARGGGKLFGHVVMAITPMELAAGARMSSFGKSGYVTAAESTVPSQLARGAADEVTWLAENGLTKNNQVWRPLPADIDSVTFKAIVGDAKFTPGGKPVGTIFDVTEGGFTEYKSGKSMLESSYQLRLQTYRSVTTETPFSIVTSRPVNPRFQQSLDFWGVNVVTPK